MINPDQEYNATRVIDCINLNTPVTSIISSPSKAKAKVKAKSRPKTKASKTRDDIFGDFSPFPYSLTESETLTAAAAELLDPSPEILPTRTAEELIEAPKAPIVHQELSIEEQATIAAIHQALACKDITEIASLLDLPFAEKHLFFSPHTMPGIFWLAVKSQPAIPIAIFKVGPARGLHDLTLLKFSKLLKMENFFQKSLIKAISIGKFIEHKPLPREFAQRPIGEDTDTENICCLSLDKRHEYYLNQAKAIHKKSLLVGSLQAFVQKDPSPIKAIDAAKMVIFAYILFVKDLKINDGGIINSIDGSPKMVDAVENALAYSSVLLGEHSAQGVLSMHIPFVDEFKNHDLSILEVEDLLTNFTIDRELFINGLLLILQQEETYAKSLQEVLAEPKLKPRTFHEGHTFITNHMLLAEEIFKRLLNVKASLEKITATKQSLNIIQLLEQLDPEYVKSYKLAEMAQSGDDFNGRLSRGTMDLMRGSCRTPGSVVGSHHSPYTLDLSISFKLADYADTLFFEKIKPLLKYVEKDSSGKDELSYHKKLLLKIRGVNELFEVIKDNFPQNQAIAFPQEGIQVHRAKEALIELNSIQSKLAPILESHKENINIIDFLANIEYLRQQISKREMGIQHESHSSSVSSQSFSSSPVRSQAISKPVDYQVDKASPEIIAIVDLATYEPQSPESALFSPIIVPPRPPVVKAKYGRSGAFMSISRIDREVAGVTPIATRPSPKK